MYNVVFEYTSKAGGYAGVRTITPYRDKADFDASNRRANDREKVIAEGVTDDEAQDLTALTPEICRLTAAIEDSCYENDGSVDPQRLLKFKLFMNVYAVEHDRSLIAEHNLKRTTDFEKCIPGPENTERNRLLRWAIEYCDDEFGQLDLALATENLGYEVLDLLCDRLDDIVANHRDASRLIPFGDE